MSFTYREDPDFRKNLRRNVVAGIDRAAFALQGQLKTTLSKSPSPSSPGQPPGVDTGTLRRSVQADRSRVETMLVSRVGTNQAYGRYLEYGTRYMAPRPWLRPTARKFRDTLAGYFEGVA